MMSNNYFKFVFMLSILAVILFSTAACQKVPAGHVGVKVYLLGGSKGVDSEELTPGRYWIGVNEELHLFPTFTQNYVWTASKDEGSETNESITFQSVEGMTVGADVGISYSIDPTKVSMIFQKYRKGIEEITDIFMRNMVRDAFVQIASTKKVEYVYGKGKAELITSVEELVSSQVRDIGINIEKVYLIGSLRLPKQVTKALNRKIAATQKAEERENEIRQTEAEAKMRIAKEQGEAEAKRIDAQGNADKILIEAQARAEANQLLSESLTAELIRYKSIERWDGKLPKMTGDKTPLVLFED